jgi:maltose alpha-D-glucosyltransferase/alpha-amylase
MTERTTKQSPLVDVAGLLRSIDYAGRSAAAGRVAGLDGRREAWTAAMSDALLSAYLDSIDAASAEGGTPGAPLVPADRAQSSLLLDLFLLEKALYEVRYELGHRPDWVAFPLAAVVELVTR